METRNRRGRVGLCEAVTGELGVPPVAAAGKPSDDKLVHLLSNPGNRRAGGVVYPQVGAASNAATRASASVSPDSDA